MAAIPPAPAVPPPPIIQAPLPPPHVAHVFTRVNIPGEDDALDYLAVSAAAGVVRGLPHLGWVDSSSVIAATRAAPCLAIAAYVSLPGFLEDQGTPAARTIKGLAEVTVVPSLPYLQRCADACESLRLFSVPITRTDVWEDKFSPALARIPHPSPFSIAAGELVEANPFEIPAVAAVAAVAARAAVRAVRGRGAAARPAVPARRAVAAVAAVPARRPAELEWWAATTVGSVYDSDSVFPLKGLWRRGAAAPDRTSSLARFDAASRVQAVSSIIYRHLGWILHDPTASHAQRARALRHSSERLYTMPDPLRSGSFSPDALETEFADDYSYGKSLAQQDAVTASRVMHVGRTYPAVPAYLAGAATVTVRRDALDALTPALSSSFASSSLYARLAPLDVFLKSHAALITTAQNQGTPLDGPQGITSLLLREHDEWGPAKEQPSLSSSAVDAETQLGRAVPLTPSALARALVEDVKFVSISAQVALLDLTTKADRKAALALTCLGKCVVFQCYQANPRSMLGRAAVFSLLHKCMVDRCSYMADAQAADPLTGVVSEQQQHWLPSEESVQHAFAGRADKFPFCNGDSGALALHNLTLSEPMKEVPDNQIYLVPSVIELVVPFASASFAAVGWPVTSTTGFTMSSLWQKQLSHVKFLLGMGDLESKSMLTEIDAAFRRALSDATTYMGNVLHDPEPATTILDCVLPFGGAYEETIARQLAAALPMITVRRAFSHLLPTSAPRSLPGVVLPSAGAASSSAGAAVATIVGSPPGGPPVGGSPPGKGATVLPPGSQQSLASWPDATHMHLGNYIYDVEAICKHYSLDPSDFCAAVNLSVKTGGAKLALCPHWKTDGHTSLTSSAHTVPKSFNLRHIQATMAKLVTGAQLTGNKRKK
jgi:hypothetical protein